MIAIDRCRACEAAWHPPRVLCPACGAADWATEPCAAGTVDECTTVRGTPPVVLASVRSAAGPVVVAALPVPVPPGTAVSLRPGPGRAVLAEPLQPAKHRV